VFWACTSREETCLALDAILARRLELKRMFGVLELTSCSNRRSVVVPSNRVTG
jgi:hypothetical protein